jgi:uncharacterized MAPEG superfamily protein
MTTAYWCVLAGALLPYLFTVLAKGQPGYDNRSPREWLEKQTGWRKRAHWAQLNAFEAFPAFAAAVIVAHLTAAPQDRIDLLAMAWILLRLAYGALYLSGHAALRSVVWALALGCVIALFVAGA